jgi:hypothetical protein
MDESSLLSSVLKIVLLGSKEKMIRIAALAIVAFVANL